MLHVESIWFREMISKLPVSEISPMLNIGSSTLHFRTKVQPYVDAEIFAPLRAKGCKVLHLDMKADEGVDLVGDLTDPRFQQELNAHGCKLFLCSNLLEHIESPGREQLCRTIVDLMPSKGYLLVSVPHAYPYHRDPIDTMFRPDERALAALFPGLRTIEGKIVVKPDVPFKDVRRRFRGTMVNLLHSMMPGAFGISREEARLERKSIPYWRRKYSACCLLLQKP